MGGLDARGVSKVLCVIRRRHFEMDACEDYYGLACVASSNFSAMVVGFELRRQVETGKFRNSLTPDTLIHYTTTTTP